MPYRSFIASFFDTVLPTLDPTTQEGIVARVQREDKIHGALAQILHEARMIRETQERGITSRTHPGEARRVHLEEARKVHLEGARRVHLKEVRRVYLEEARRVYLEESRRAYLEGARKTCETR